MLLRKMSIGFLFVIIVGILAGPFIQPIHAEVVQTEQVQNQAADPIDPSLIFTTMAALSGAVLALTALLKKWLQTNDTLTIVVSGVISLIVSAVGYWLQAGIFAAVEWWYFIIYGLVAMAVANGLSTWEFIKAILILFKLKVPAEKKR